ncbi:normocyte-binding protein [Metasolibacillus meyeri]|uniref:Normocyte-binding protein n=1 Tax=Metasolibacillus meyeri TaxID=1071052 RepID=A0AAW9NR67_9BACL|nr:normocyte-binding protein [Metasolibacillus meyeri]MEC1180047.1 normocyte-binding protein [Metasolibacillus meyeri]
MLMKELMLERLKKIENLEQRQLLKDVMSSVFANLIDYQQQMNSQLEQRLLDELNPSEQQLDIYGTITSKEQFDPIHEYLFPMIATDLEQKPLSMGELKHEQSPVLCTLFLQCDTWQIQKLLAEKRQFHGKLHTVAGDISVQLYLTKHQAYIKAIEELYKTFQINGIPWRTINHPYIHKFVDVRIIPSPLLQDEEEILDVTIDLEEYEPYKRLNMLPIWNVAKHEVKNAGFPVPAIDKINFEHTLSVRKLGAAHGYLVVGDETTIRYVKRSESTITVVSPHDISDSWQLIKIANVQQDKMSTPPYELFSNRPIDHFMHRLTTRYPIAIHTAGELTRFIHSFDLANRLAFIDFEMVETEIAGSYSYVVNPFLSEIINNPRHKKTLVLRFKALKQQDFIANDLLSFVVAEVQRHFYEYNCIGVWQ